MSFDVKPESYYTQFTEQLREEYGVSEAEAKQALHACFVLSEDIISNFISNPESHE